MKKVRLDVLLAERGEAASREQAKTMIMEGLVFVNGVREDKPGTSFDPEKIKSLEIKGTPFPYVSRGALKLQRALDVWRIPVKDLICLDIGASTGGFTDLMLQEGAAKVYAVDSGYGQLHYKLRSDPKVVCMEKTNFRYATRTEIPEDIGFACADVSFISLSLILPAAFPLLKEGAQMVCLVKPQFEAGREQVGKKGVVKDRRVHAEVLGRVLGYARDSRFFAKAVTWSPVKGPEGNIEFLLLLEKRSEAGCEITEQEIADCVEEAHTFAK